MSTSAILFGGNSATQTQASAKKSAAEEMSERFMTLFLAQLRNQDPLNPMDNTEMTSQLAQMNMVSGLESLNTSMKTLLGSYQETLSLQAANLIGKNVLVPGKAMTLTEEGALFGLELATAADNVNVVIYDSNGTEVSRQNLGQQEAGAMAFLWDGKDAEGNALPVGQYRFEVAASLAGAAVGSTPLQAGTVSALVRGTNGFGIEIAGYGNVALEDLRQIF
jgi:flagellar basal-body rod modification protein FlgD